LDGEYLYHRKKEKRGGGREIRTAKDFGGGVGEEEGTRTRSLKKFRRV